MTLALMLMGTGSDVGKSLLVAGLCRAFADRGLSVAPFKPQNMSNNAAVTDDGGEIGRAQALQARAARKRPLTAMNPVLLKPEGDSRSQLIVRGQRRSTPSAREFWSRRGELLPEITAAFDELASTADLVIVEGAGSASEVNLRHNDIANFGFARARDVPVILVGDIERGGVIASIVGTFAVIALDDAALITATLINKFRGDPALFVDGAAFIATRTGVPCLGPIPWFEDAKKLPAEDSLALAQLTGTPSTGKLVISVLQLPHIANFDDLDPLRGEPGVDLRMIAPGFPIPRDTDLIIIPGTKSTRADLQTLRAEWWDSEIFAHWRAGRPILGICGGYQMLGHSIADPHGIEGAPGSSDGLGLLEVATVLTEKKQLRVETGYHHGTGQPITGYHMHLGQTDGDGAGSARPFANVDGVDEGTTSKNGLIMGTYLHGLFASDSFRHAFLNSIRSCVASDFSYEMDVEGALDRLAAHLETHLDLDALLALARPPRS